MKRVIVVFAASCICIFSQAQIKISIGKYSTTVIGSLTVDYVVRTIGKTDLVTSYFNIDNDSIYFSQLRKRENETKYYLYYLEKAAIADLDLSSKVILETGMLEKGKTFYYVDLYTKGEKVMYTFFVNDSGVMESKEESAMSIYCYSRALSQTIYDNIKLKQDSQK